MSTGTDLAKRIREVFINGTWIANTNYKSSLVGISHEEATKIVHDCNSIAALIFHINYYLKGLLDVFQGGPLLISDRFSFEMPELKSENDWQNQCKMLETNAELFAELVSRLTEEQLSSAFVAPQYGSNVHNIQGLIEHSYYHLGQIVLLKKIIRSNLN
jgi:uncharacterized damage-inducible protein DinB